MKKIFTIAMVVLLIAAFAVVSAGAAPEHLKIDVCHKDGRSGNYSLINVNINSVEDAQNVGGHGNHDGDAWASFTFGGVNYAGRGDMSNCNDTEEPTATLTSTALPTATNTIEPTATGTLEATATLPPEVTPTATPVDIGVPGCMTVGNENYDPNATVHDQSYCHVNPPSEWCTDLLEGRADQPDWKDIPACVQWMKNSAGMNLAETMKLIIKSIFVHK